MTVSDKPQHSDSYLSESFAFNDEKLDRLEKRIERKIFELMKNPDKQGRNRDDETTGKS